MTSPSYDTKAREKFLLMHALNIGASWVKDDKSTKNVISLLNQDSRNLPTLLNVLNFVRQTVDEDGKDIDKLKEKMITLSEETPSAFAREIKTEHYDLIEFLAFPFISNSLKREFVKSRYEELIKDKKYKERYGFERIAEIFKDKISTENYVRFRHPSYFEALPFLLKIEYETPLDRQDPVQIIHDFSKVILKLADDKRVVSNVFRRVSYWRPGPVATRCT